MLCTSSRLVFIQNNGLIRISTGSIQPHITVALWLLSRLMKHLQGSLIRMENVSLEKFHVQLFIYRNQVIFRRFQNPIGHGLTAQVDTFSVNLLFLPV